ncbi:hypothetical protein BAUCODRAFT_36836 [Baudoinia panamericana UAMH 10762]|uniref:Borealin N-terminal domain-containing protein n=1 Tax=Baudoinia panamericana (strain UAMH 10762) TaxID=717646 RepID=M2N390_BAUPA|nr:uncharacterized protein BAUCODRAFT_36836 [Baudoinia panamericana UAMH 10762]EMC93170.1 hypothetical protein BAUCODRAFT_36836 [Baudoinia panamericana UAMH 10762]
MRINRIPHALRKRNMQELLDEHAEKAKPASPPPMLIEDDSQRAGVASNGTAVEPNRLKRQSHFVAEDEDKENAPANASHDLANPKKRAKTATANTKATRTASRKGAPSTVLSPKSHNSRTLAQSPARNMPSPVRTTMVRPLSPVKPSMQHLAPPKPSSRTLSRQALRPLTAMESEGRSSEVSTASAGTTIVTKPAAKKAAATRKPAVGKTATTAKKPAVAKKEAAAPAATGGGRTLRKRG